ncbi:MAG: porin [Betaproteobacteria bacterium]|nr:porin [Betaproteobacteria bacterium]
MKKKILVTALVAASTTSTAFARDSLTLYGMIDAGFSYVSNQGGSSTLKFDDGISVPSLLGFRGSEDLDGGWSAIFDLQTQFSVGTGSAIPGADRPFGRNAWVGLRSTQFGTLTMGNQFDFINDSLTVSNNVAAVFVGGLYNYAAGPFQGLMLPAAASPNGSAGWDRTSQVVLPNSVKYVTPVFGGFKAGAMYAFGEKPGDFHTDSKNMGARCFRIVCAFQRRLSGKLWCRRAFRAT